MPQGGGQTLPKWGTAWSNRIYRRVVHLDKVARASGMVNITRTESRAASRALNLVIMAFATQWSQNNSQGHRHPMSPADTYQPRDFADQIADEFEQNLQLSVWEQAKKALQDVSEVESYRVVYAEMIFGLTQRPCANDQHLDELGSQCSATASTKAIVPMVMKLLSQDGPPIFLERAARKMHTLKYNFESNETGFMETSHAYQSHRGTLHIDMEERSTIGLLYWLAVMFDTVSASMNERPIALGDEECQHDAVHEGVSKPEIQKSHLRWDIDLFPQDDPDTLHWPCPEGLAAAAVTRSAPIKVLLFRHVSYLQNALGRKHYHLVEDIIQSTITTYRYWNSTYGALFRDLVKDYDSVPPRLKSWFICIAIPWHLAALMLSELIDFVDKHNLGSAQHGRSRQEASMTMRIRQSSAIELSDLARVTAPLRDWETQVVTAQQLPDFHFAVNEGPLLTEPWTVLLVRAFTKAALFHFGVAEDLKQHDWAVLGHGSDDLQQSTKRAEYCTKALWSLGKKSRMAKDIAEVLFGELRK